MSKKIVKASAGTGKTYRLALEYIARLLAGEDYSEILFMTFTRSATAELKGRIFDFLRELAETGREGELAGNIQGLYPGMELNIEGAGDLYRKLLLNKDKLKIFTIDSFTGMVFKKAIGPYLNIYAYGHMNQKDEERVYREVFSRLVSGDNFQKVKNFLEKTADRNVDKYMDLIKKVSQERWKFSLIEPKGDEGDGDILRDELFKNLTEVLLCLKELVEKHGKDMEKVLGDKTASKRIYDRFGEEWLPSKSVLALVLEDMDFFRGAKYYNGKQTMAKKGGMPELKERLEMYQENIYDLLDKLVYTEKILPYERDIIEIEGIIRDIYDEIKFKEKGLTFGDITNYTSEYMYREELDLVRDGLVTENFYDIVGGRIGTLFLDEAQDTSVSQWKIIEPIAKAAKNVIVVGDEKQSIYSWRGGEKNLFMSMGRILDASEDNLPVSYRSEQKIIEFINYFFTWVNKAEEEWKYTEVRCNREETKKGFVAVLTKANHEEDSLEEGIARDIEERFQGVYQGIGIISRKTKTLDTIGEALKSRGIPFVTENSMSISQHPCIVEVLRLLRYILRRDYFSLMEFYRGHSIGIGDSHLSWLLHNQKECERYLDGLAPEEAQVPEELIELLDKTRKVMESPYEKLGRRLIEEFGLLTRYTAPRDIKNIRFFQEIMEGMDNLSELMEYIEDNELSEELKQVGISELNSVVLMSIHKSKGLEFHTEYMYIEDKKSSYRMTGYAGNMTQHQVALMTKMDERYEGVEEYLFTNSIYEKNIKEREIYKYVEKTYLDEEINTLYVGMTRPVANLILCINPTSSKSRKTGEVTYKLSNELIVPPILKYFGTDEETLLEKGLAEAGVLVPYEEKKKEERSYRADREVFREACQKVFEPEEEEAQLEEGEYDYNVDVELRRKRGLAVHYFLENLESLERDDLERAKKLTYLKYGNMLGDERVREIMDTGEKFLLANSEIFDPRFAVYKELELRTGDDSEAGRGTHIIDRLNVDHKSGEIIIYDYKSGRTRDQAQLDRYERVILEKLREKTRDVQYRVVKKKFLTVG